MSVDGYEELYSAIPVRWVRLVRQYGLWHYCKELAVKSIVLQNNDQLL